MSLVAMHAMRVEGCVLFPFSPARFLFSPRPHMKKALITGITGQDGSYLADLLLEKGYEVH